MTKKYVLILGIVLVALGVLGFVTPLAPSGSLFGIFATSTMHSLTYVVFGILGLAAVAGGKAYPKAYAQAIGVIFGLFTIIGFMIGDGEVLGLLNVNAADNVLNLVIAATALYVGYTHNHPTGTTAAV